ncbi:MAG: FkbM family methyltransferase [Candidatus Liptonbacteria bacterium]|nr:FkbM family methyltransferase [Candidatus Liptonbacteria bacterium]
MEASLRITHRNILAWCATITAFFLIFRSGMGPKSADILLAILGILVVAGAESRAFLKALWPRMRVYVYCFAAIIFFVALAQFITYVRFGANPVQPAILGLYARMLFDAYAFLLMAFLIAFDRRLLKWVSAAILISPIVMAPIYLQHGPEWYLSGSRLAGFLKNPIVLGVWTMVAIFIGLGFSLDVKSAWKKIPIIAWLAVIASFNLWSGTRASWVALAFGLLLWIWFSYFKERSVGKALYLASVSFIIFSLGHAILAIPSRPNQQIQSFITERSLTLITQPLSQQTNTYEWSEGIPLAAMNPWGLGFYVPRAPQHFDTNTFLEIMLDGGIGALAAFFIILWKIGESIKGAIAGKEEGTRNNLAHAWLVVALAIGLTIFFTNSFFFRLVWIALGITLGVAWTHQKRGAHDETSKLDMYIKKWFAKIRVHVVAFVWKTGVELFRGKGLQKVWPFGLAYDWMVSVFETYEWPEAIDVRGYKIYTTKLHRASLALWGAKGDEPEFQLFDREIKPESTVIDVGANIGFYALHLARATGNKGMVFSFEPGPENVKFLNKNIIANNCRNITVVPKAVGSHSGKANLFLAHEAGGHQVFDVRKIIASMPHPTEHQQTLLDDRKKHGDYEQSVPIDLVSLDDFFKDYNKPIGFVKIDVEGAEDTVIDGMQNILRKNPEIKLCFEFTPTFLMIRGIDPKKTLEKLQNLGFVFYDVHDKRNQGRLAQSASIEQLLAACKGNTAIDVFAQRM